MFVLPLITLLIIYYYYSQKNQLQFGPINLLLVVYLVMGIIAIILEFSGLFPSIFPISFAPMAYLSLSFIIIFSGFFNFRDQDLNYIKIENVKLFKLFEFTLLVGGLGALIFFLPFAISGLSGDVDLNRLAVFEFQENILAKYGLINSIFSLFASMFIYMILLAFIRFTVKESFKDQIMGYLLLLSSFSYVIYVLAYVGRDGVVYWLLSYSFLYLLFKKFTPPKIKKKLVHQYIIFVGIFIIPFLIISFARFATTAEGVGWKLLEYAGCQLKNFSDSFYINPPLLHGKYTMPVLADFFSLIGFNIEDAKFQDRFPYYLAVGVDPWTFKTFVGDLLMDFGKFGTLLFLIILALFTRLSIKRVAVQKHFIFSNLIIFVLLYQMVLWGVFYFRFYSMNFYIIAMVLIAVFFKIFTDPNSEKIIEHYKD